MTEPEAVSTAAPAAPVIAHEGVSTPALAALLLAAAQAPLGSTMIAVALPSISQALHRELSLVTSLLVTSYLIVNIVGQSPGGRLADALGHARTVRIGMFLQAVGSCVGFFSQGLVGLVMARALLACGGALIVPATMALLRVHVPAERRGRVFGWVGATMGFSAAIGPPIGGELLGLFGWRSIFVVALPCVALAAVLTRIYRLPASHTERKTLGAFARSFDWIGSLLLTVALATLVISSKGPVALRWPLLGAGLVTIVAFVFWELRQRDPVLDPRIFRVRAFSAGSGVVALQNFSMYGLLFELPGYFERVRGAQAHAVGRVLFAMMIAMFICAPLGGRLTDRIGPRKTALIAVLPGLAGMLLLRHIGSFLVPSDAIPALVLLGIGLGLSGAPAQTSALTSVSGERSGMAAGATSTLRYLGSVVSVLTLGALLGGDQMADVTAHAHTIDVFCIGYVLASLGCLALPDHTNAVTR